MVLGRVVFERVRLLRFPGIVSGFSRVSDSHRRLVDENDSP
jgi:hypothetical protein